MDLIFPPAVRNLHHRMSTVTNFYSPKTVTLALQDITVKMFPEPSPQESAAARVQARHGIHADQQHLLSAPKGGMHANYLAVEKDKRKYNLVKETEDDLWDAVCPVFLFSKLTELVAKVTALDQIDGGFSFVIRCPGLVPEEVQTSERPLQILDIQLLTYLPPRDVEENRGTLEVPIAQICQLFVTEIALPHLHRLQERCKKSKVNIRYMVQNQDIPRVGQLLPNPSAGSSKFSFGCENEPLPP